MQYDLHKYDRRLKRALATLPQANVSPPDQQVILDFHDDCFLQGLSTPRVEKYVRHLVTLAAWAPVPFEQAGIDHVKQMLRTIRSSDYAEWTKHDLRLTLKKLYMWLRHSGRF